MDGFDFSPKHTLSSLSERSELLETSSIVQALEMQPGATEELACTAGMGRGGL